MGLEMQNDFEGTMHDMPDDEEGEQNDSEDIEELDREMGDFDHNDENVVDEKLWGEDSDDDEDRIDEEKLKFEENSEVKGEAIEDEVRDAARGRRRHDDIRCHPDVMRCQYSSKRCYQERTHKKSGGLHKFCAMHREKANRNKMRLDHRRRVLKQQQRELQ
ncbi:hypothetical protein PsorP6_010744 [Peronosclerospora sorghi]|uniref:Uncharacterized protein n=1 Tax=Peronosclerospora sorghi TaxID=230839 RepID=A0ACC0VWB5_9STRA|nr:hypothetical protein PsorP6_010744 [Peronosclerospora sorghi]